MKPYLKMNYLCKEIVMLHAHLCGDGYLYKKLEKRSPSNIKRGRTGRFERYIIEYTNNDFRLLFLVEKIIKKIVPLTYISRGEKFIRIRNKLLFDYMKSLGCGKTGEWMVPIIIITNPNYRKLWLRAFFDDEGCVKKNSIEVYTSNKEGAKQVIKMLNLEDIRSTVYIRPPRERNYRYLYTIRISNFDCFKFKNIGFDHSQKKIKLKQFLNKRMHQPGFEPGSSAFS